MTRRPHQPDDQLAFDIDAMIHDAEVAASPPWLGAPLHFTVDPFSPAELTAAFEHWCFLHGRLDSLRASHMWHHGMPADPHATTPTHSLVTFSADLRCDFWKHDLDRGQHCSCVGGLLHQGICEPCDWHYIDASENRMVEAWHDHAWPGWRTLPVIPAKIRLRDERGLTKPARTWIEEHYPTPWQTEGAPIITERSQGGTRHVPSYSPWGGFDISATAL